jgi:hypothetical protein
VSDTRFQTRIAVAVSVVCFAAIEFFAHFLLLYLRIPPLADAVADALLMGVAFGLAVWMLLVANRERRARVRQDLERIAEINHEIRNALQVIAHSHFDADATRREMVMESVARIDDVLKRLFPVVGRSMPPEESRPGALS